MMPLSLSFSFFVGIWPHRPRNYDNYFLFSLMHKLSFDDKFCIVCLVCVCMLPLSLQHFVLVVV